MNKEELEKLTDDIVEYTFERLEEKLKDFKIEFKKELDRQIENQTYQILVGNSKIADRITRDLLRK